MSRHPSGEEIAAYFYCPINEVYDAFASVGQIVGNVPRSAAKAIMEEWFA